MLSDSSANTEKEVGGVATNISRKCWSCYSFRLQSLQAKEVGDAQTKASNAIVEAARLGVKVDQLPAFVNEKEKKINDEIGVFKDFADKENAENADIIVQLTSAKKTLEKVRSDALDAAEGSKKDMAGITALVAKENEERKRHWRFSLIGLYLQNNKRR